MFIREYSVSDIRQMTEIWNEIVEAGVAFPQARKSIFKNVQQ